MEECTSGRYTYGTQEDPLSPQSTTLSQRVQKKYSFKEEHVLKIFNMLANNNKIELPKLKRSEEVGCTKNSK